MRHIADYKADDTLMYNWHKIHVHAKQVISWHIAVNPIPVGYLNIPIPAGEGPYAPPVSSVFVASEIWKSAAMIIRTSSSITNHQNPPPQLLSHLGADFWKWSGGEYWESYLLVPKRTKSFLNANKKFNQLSNSVSMNTCFYFWRKIHVEGLFRFPKYFHLQKWWKTNRFFTITQKVFVTDVWNLVYRNPRQISYKIGENSAQIGQKKFLVFYLAN